jgi:NAD(P)-dependent dehydrogenase (short-subunit alcohol dehydrogenase family)
MLCRPARARAAEEADVRLENRVALVTGDGSGIGEATVRAMAREGAAVAVVDPIDTNLTGTFLTVKHSIPHLRAAGGGAIVITASVNGNRRFSAPGYSAYSTSKGGQAVFGRMAAQELARWGIRVNTVCPGAIRTNLGERTWRRNLEAVRWDMTMPAHFPPLHGRPAEASEVADVVLFLASDESAYVTGTEIHVDAGMTLLRG